MAELLKVLLCVSIAISRILMPVLFLNIRLVLERSIRGVSRKLRRGVLVNRHALAHVIFLVTPPYFVTTLSILLVDGCNVKCKKPN